MLPSSKRMLSGNNKLVAAIKSLFTTSNSENHPAIEPVAVSETRSALAQEQTITKIVSRSPPVRDQSRSASVFSQSPFARLSTEILLRIVQFIYDTSRSSAYNLLFIKDIKHVAESVVYKSFTLCDPNSTESTKWSATQRVIDRIQDPKDLLSAVVRSLTIEYLPSKIGTSVLMEMLSRIESLQDLSWNLSEHIPTEALELISERFPDARIHVKNVSRGRATQLDALPMDVQLLLSPQLHSLEYVVLKEVDEPWRDEMDILAQILQRNRSLKTLRFACQSGKVQDLGTQISPHGLAFDTSRKTRLVRLPLLEKGNIWIDKFSFRLEDLTFLPGSYGTQTYNLGGPHCRALKQCLDCSKLTVVDLGLLPAAVFYQTFMGSMAQLKTLRVAVNSDDEIYRGPAGIQLLGEFLDSITALQELLLRLETDGFFPLLWPQVKRHGKSLRKLDTESLGRAVRSNWNAETVKELADACPVLEELSVDLDPVQDVDKAQSFGNRSYGNADNVYLWPQEAHTTICQLPKLKTLSTRVTFPAIWADRTGWAERNFSVTIAKEFFESVHRSNLSCHLEVLSLQGKRYVPRPEWRAIDEHIYRISIATLERDDAPDPADGGFKVSTETTVVEE